MEEAKKWARAKAHPDPSFSVSLSNVKFNTSPPSPPSLSLLRGGVTGGLFSLLPLCHSPLTRGRRPLRH